MSDTDKRQNLKAQAPAEGILKTHDWGNSKMYLIPCSCTNDDDAIRMEVEASDHEIMVTHYTTQKTNYWSEAVKPRYDIDNVWLQEFDWFWKGLINGLATRLKLSWTLWSKGYVEYQCTTLMTKQQALNYAETLKTAIKDTEQFEKERKTK